MTIDWNAVRKDIEWLEKDYKWFAAQQRQLDAMREITVPNLDVIQSAEESIASTSDLVSDFDHLHAQAADALDSISSVPDIKVYTGFEIDWVDHLAIPETVETTAQFYKWIQELVDLPSLIDLPPDFSSLVGGSLVEAVDTLHRFIDDWTFSYPDRHMLDDIAREISSCALAFDELNEMIIKYAMSNYQPQWAQASTSNTLASRRREPLDPVLVGIGLATLGTFFIVLGLTTIAIANLNHDVADRRDLLTSLGERFCAIGATFFAGGCATAARGSRECV